MSEVLVVVLSFALNAALPYWIVKRDLAKLSPQRLELAWNEASFLSAVFAFGPFSLPVHFVKTRRSWAGFGLGIGAAFVTILCSSLAESGLSWLIGAS